MIAYIGIKDNLYISEYIKEISDKTIDFYTDIEDTSVLFNKISSTSHYTDIVIDLDIFKQSDTIKDSIFVIRSMMNINIIIVSIKYSVGSKILSDIFSLGIYNIITALEDIKLELSICFNTPKNFSSSQKFYLQEETKVKEKGKILIKKENNFIKQLVTIGFVGSMGRMGTTTQALALAKFISENSKHCCYIEGNRSGHVTAMGEVYADAVIEKDRGLVKLAGIDMFENIYNISEVMARGYEFIVYDYGVIDDNNLSSFLEKDIKIVCGGTKTWEMRKLISDIFPWSASIEDVYYMFNFCSDQEKAEVLGAMDEKSKYTFFTCYRPDFFEKLNIETKVSFQKILSNFLSVDILTEEAPKNKFRLFKR